jgi:hypothetical protein
VNGRINNQIIQPEVEDSGEDLVKPEGNKNGQRTHMRKLKLNKKKHNKKNKKKYFDNNNSNETEEVNGRSNNQIIQPEVEDSGEYIVPKFKIPQRKIADGENFKGRKIFTNKVMKKAPSVEEEQPTILQDKLMKGAKGIIPQKKRKLMKPKKKGFEFEESCEEEDNPVPQNKKELRPVRPKQRNVFELPKKNFPNSPRAIRPHKKINSPTIRALINEVDSEELLEKQNEPRRQILLPEELESGGKNSFEIEMSKERPDEDFEIKDGQKHKSPRKNRKPDKAKNKGDIVFDESCEDEEELNPQKDNQVVLKEPNNENLLALPKEKDEKRRRREKNPFKKNKPGKILNALEKPESKANNVALDSPIRDMDNLKNRKKLQKPNQKKAKSKKPKKKKKNIFITEEEPCDDNEEPELSQAWKDLDDEDFELDTKKPQKISGRMPLKKRTKRPDKYNEEEEPEFEDNILDEISPIKPDKGKTRANLGDLRNHYKPLNKLNKNKKKTGKSKKHKNKKDNSDSEEEPCDDYEEPELSQGWKDLDDEDFEFDTEKPKKISGRMLLKKRTERPDKYSEEEELELENGILDEISPIFNKGKTRPNIGAFRSHLKPLNKLNKHNKKTKKPKNKEDNLDSEEPDDDKEPELSREWRDLDIEQKSQKHPKLKSEDAYLTEGINYDGLGPQKLQKRPNPLKNMNILGYANNDGLVPQKKRAISSKIFDENQPDQIDQEELEFDGSNLNKRKPKGPRNQKNRSGLKDTLKVKRNHKRPKIQELKDSGEFFILVYNFIKICFLGTFSLEPHNLKPLF